MRLRRVEAVRFGRVDGLTVDGISPRLTVIVGPNEAGKSSLTALVRYVLYGFPTRAAVSEPPYVAASGGNREGRLIFGDERGEWVIERVEGPNGGQVTVRALTGDARPGLATDLTAGVSKPAYRVVFGFGLADMQQIETLKGKDDDLFQQLYAASAGLGARLIDARTDIDGALDELWKKGGSAPRLNRLKAEREQTRIAIRDLTAQADSLRDDALRLEELEPQLEAARLERTSAQVRAERIARAVSDAERFAGDAVAASADAERLTRESALAESEAAGNAVDASALQAAPVVAALAGGLSGFRNHVAAVTATEQKLSALDARVREAVADSGWDAERALAAASDAGVAAQIESFRERLAAARAAADFAAAGQAARTSPTASGGSWRMPGFVITGLGVAGLLTGVLLSQMGLAVFAGLLAVVGLVLALAGAGPARPGGVRGAVATRDDAVVRVRAEWAEFVRSHGLGDGTEDPGVVAVRYAAARAARTVASDRPALEAELAGARDSVDVFTARVASVIAPLLGESADVVAPDRASELVSRGQELVSAAQEAAAAQSEATARATGLRLESSELALVASRAADAAAQALASVGCETSDIEAAREREVAARGAYKDAVDACDRLSIEVAEIRTRLGAESRDASLADLRLAAEGLTQRIEAGVREYAVLALASHLLAHTQARYERDRQPDVVKHAESAFALMTDGRYPRISVPLGKEAIEVFDASSASIPPSQLSRGTAEQLYLALRLGLIEQSGTVGADLPVLMDDVLVDFSPKRAEQAARAIADLATRRQVIFLTCHPATADLLCAVASGAARVELPSRA